jgi:hypothetical protein
MMKSRKPLSTALAVGTLLFAGSLIAQNMPPPMSPPPPAATAPTPPPPMPPAPPSPPQQSGMPATPPPPPTDTMNAPPGSQTDTATMNTPAGELTVHSSMPPPPPAGPAPSFEQLSGGGKSISEDQATAYPLLANDFIYADHNRNGRVSKSEYARWLSQE